MLHSELIFFKDKDSIIWKSPVVWLVADLHHSGCSLDAGVLDRLCAGGRLAVPLRAGHRVGEEVRQRAQPRHNSASADRSCRARVSLAHYLRLILHQQRLDPETQKARVSKRLRRGRSGRVGELVGGSVVVRQTRRWQARAAAGGCKLPTLPQRLLLVGKAPENSNHARKDKMISLTVAEMHLEKFHCMPTPNHKTHTKVVSKREIVWVGAGSNCLAGSATSPDRCNIRPSSNRDDQSGKEQAILSPFPHFHFFSFHFQFLHRSKLKQK